MVSAVILARKFDSTSFAAYSYFQLTVSMLAAYTAMGLGIAASKFFAEVGEELVNIEPPPIGTLCTLSFVLAVGAFLIIIFMPTELVTAGLAVPKWLVALGVFTFALTVVPSGAILGLERFKEATLISGIGGVATLLVVWWASYRGSPALAMYAIVLSVFIQAVGESIVVIKTVGWQRIAVGLRLRPDEVRRVINLAGPMFFVTLLAASGSWLIGRMILHGAGGERAFASYVIGLQWFSLGLLLPGTFARVLLPRLIRSKFSDLSESGGKRLVRQGAIMATVAALVTAILGLLFSSWLILIYGDQYQSDRWIIAAFLGAAVLCAPANTLGNAIVAQNGQRTWLALSGVWLIVLLTSGAIAMPLGPLAGALAHAIAAATLSVLAYLVARTKRVL